MRKKTKGKDKGIVINGCHYCGCLADETPGEHRRAKKSHCCQKCFIKFFATPEQIADYKDEQADKKESSQVVLPKVKRPQRIERGVVKLKTVIWD